MKKLFFISLLAVLFASCEDEIDVDLDEGENQLVIDGFITNDNSIQVIRLTESATYFLNAPTPEVNNATVQVEGPNGVVYNFVSDNNGNFNYDPNTLGALDSIGFTYKLSVQYDNSTYTATSTLNPVPPIDSMTQAYEEGGELGGEDGYYTQFWATDFFGRKDYYWIKAYKNGVPINEDDPSSLILSEDGSFGGISPNNDTIPFIAPLRGSITNSDEPFTVGDTSSVELLSLNRDAFEYLEQATIQANNGGLFSTPPANVRPTIKDAYGNRQNEVLGVFSISAINRSQIIVQTE